MPLEPGQTLLHYRLISKIGEGGMGEVFAAEDTKLGRKVALKVLPDEMAANAERLARFEREARTVAALNHPNIVTLHSVEKADGVHFMTMELVEGKPLSRHIPRDGLPLNDLLDLAIPMADAVSAGHEAGITHRDVKPDNVMVGDDGRVKVLDFGLAKLIEEGASGAAGATQLPTSSITQEGKIVGTVSYMSPEQAEGKPVDARSDVFSMGIVLYQMATGRRPFDGDTAISTISSILKEQPPPIVEINRSLPRHLSRIVTHCLAKDPKRRYQSAGELRRELEGLREESMSGELSLPQAPATPAPRSSRLAWVFGVVAVAAVALAAWQLLAGRGESGSGTDRTDRPEMEITRLTASGSAGEAIISADGRYVVYVVNDEGRVSMWVSQVATGSRVEILPASGAFLWDPAFSPDGEFVYYIRYEDPGPPELFRIPTLGGTSRKILSAINGRPSFSPDGSEFVFLWSDPETWENRLDVASVDGSNRRTIASVASPNELNDPSWSPDGQVIATSMTRYEPRLEATVVTVPAAGGELKPLSRRTWLDDGELAWLPDGSGVIANASEMFRPQLWEIAYPSGQVSRITRDVNSYHGVSLTARGDTLATVLTDRHYNLWVQPVGDGSDPTRVTSGSRDDSWGLDWTPDGRVVYASTIGDKLDIWISDADGKNATRLTREAHNGGSRVTADGRFIVFLSTRAGTINIWRMDLDGGNPVQLTSGPMEIDPHPTPDGQWVVYSEPATGRLLRVPIDGGEPVVIRAERGGSGEVSPDGNWILTGSYDVEAERWQTEVIPFEGGDPVRTYYEDYTDLYRWRPDGGICYEKTELGVGNLWCLPPGGGEAVQVTHADADDISAYAWSRDGKRLVIARGRFDQDIVLLKHFR